MKQDNGKAVKYNDLLALRDQHIKEAERCRREVAALGLNDQYLATVCELSGAKHIKKARELDVLIQKILWTDQAGKKN